MALNVQMESLPMEKFSIMFENSFVKVVSTVFDKTVVKALLNNLHFFF